MKYSIHQTAKNVAAHTNLPVDLVKTVIKAYGGELSRIVQTCGPSARIPIPWLGTVEVWQRPEAKCSLENIDYRLKARKKVKLVPHRHIRVAFNKIYKVSPVYLDPLGDLSVATGDDPQASS